MALTSLTPLPARKNILGSKAVDLHSFTPDRYDDYNSSQQDRNEVSMSFPALQNSIGFRTHVKQNRLLKYDARQPKALYRANRPGSSNEPTDPKQNEINTLIHHKIEQLI